MQYIPNNKKVCYVCGTEILYNQNYEGVDRLSATGELQSTFNHECCLPLGQNSLSGISHPLSGASSQSYVMGITAAPQQQQHLQIQGLSGTIYHSPYLQAPPLTPYGKSKKPTLCKTILRILFGGRHGRSCSKKSLKEEDA